MLPLILDILAAAWVIAAANGIGWWVIRGRIAGAPRSFRWFVGQAAGFTVIIAAAFALGAIHQFRSIVAMVGLAFGVVPSVPLIRFGAVGRLSAAVKEWWLEAWPVILPTLFIVVVGFSTALSPEVRYDSITYHISAAMLYVVNRGHVEIPSSVLTYIPENMQLLYALGLALGSDVVARIIHWWFGVMLLLGTAGMARILGCGRRMAAGAAFLVASFPIWLYLASSTYIDFGPAVYLLGAVGLLVHARIQRDSSDARPMWAVIWGGIFTGMAMGCKYTAIAVGFAPLLAMLLAGRFRIRDIALFASISVAAFLPWLLRNFLWTGNPLAPSFMKWLGPAGVPEATLLWPDIQAGEPGAMWPLQNIVTGWVAMFLQLKDYGNYLPWLALILGSVAWLGLRNNGSRTAFPPAVNLLLVFVIVGFCFGVPLGAVRRDSRYIMASVGIVAALIALWVQLILSALPKSVRLTRWVLSGCAALLFLAWGNTSYQRFQDLGENLLPPLNRETRLDYAAAHLRGYRQNLTLGEVNGIIPFQGLVLGAGYPARVNYVLQGMPITPDFLDQDLTKLKPASLDALKRRGVKHLFGTITDELRKSGRVHEGQRIGGIPVWNIVN